MFLKPTNDDYEDFWYRHSNNEEYKTKSKLRLDIARMAEAYERGAVYDTYAIYDAELIYSDLYLRDKDVKEFIHMAVAVIFDSDRFEQELYLVRNEGKGIKLLRAHLTLQKLCSVERRLAALERESSNGIEK